MKMLKRVCSSFLLFACFNSAKIKVEAVRLNQTDLQVNPLVIELNQIQLQLIDSILLEAELIESDQMIFNLAFRGQNGNFTNFYRSDRLAIKDGDEIVFGSAEGFSLVVRVYKVE